MSKLRYSEIKTKAKEFLALTSLTPDEFELLVPAFENAFQEHMSKWQLDGKLRSKRSYTTYANCPLPSAEDRLLFILSYVKGNPIQSNHGVLFGMAQGKTNSWLHTLLPVLRATFRNLALAPARSVSELALRLEGDLPCTGAAPAAPDGPLPLFAMMPQNGALSAPKMRLHRKRAIAARKEPIR
jgi:Helix-turn-helix of DDE superfamily endonuclease